MRPMLNNQELNLFGLRFLEKLDEIAKDQDNFVDSLNIFKALELHALLDEMQATKEIVQFLLDKGWIDIGLNYEKVRINRKGINMIQSEKLVRNLQNQLFGTTQEKITGVNLLLENYYRLQPLGGKDLLLKFLSEDQPREVKMVAYEYIKSHNVTTGLHFAVIGALAKAADRNSDKELSDIVVKESMRLTRPPWMEMLTETQEEQKGNHKQSPRLVNIRGRIRSVSAASSADERFDRMSPARYVTVNFVVSYGNNEYGSSIVITKDDLQNLNVTVGDDLDILLAVNE
jgi:hypothetical protein